MAARSQIRHNNQNSQIRHNNQNVAQKYAIYSNRKCDTITQCTLVSCMVSLFARHALPCNDFSVQKPSGGFSFSKMQCDSVNHLPSSLVCFPKKWHQWTLQTTTRNFTVMKNYMVFHTKTNSQNHNKRVKNTSNDSNMSHNLHIIRQ